MRSGCSFDSLLPHRRDIRCHHILVYVKSNITAFIFRNLLVCIMHVIEINYLFWFGCHWKLREYVDDTEDYINIMLDDKQNHLLQMGVMLTTATLVVSAFVVVAGIFGMNIQIDLFSDEKAGMQEFMWTVGGGATGSVFLYVIAIAWCKHKRLLE